MNLKKSLLWILSLTSVYNLNSQTVSETFFHPNWSYNVSIYEVNIRQFSPEGNFVSLMSRLPEIKELGVGIIWLMPIHPIGIKNRKGSLGSYYSIKDYFDVNPEFGNKADFKMPVDSIHALGMKVIIDWVANHSAWDNEWTITNPDFYRKDKSGNFLPPLGTDWSDVIDFDYTNLALHDKMIDALKYWVSEFDIDGYRCDVAARVPLDFWEKARRELNKLKPVFMLAEAHEPELHNFAFDMTYNWQLKDIMNNISKKKNSPSDIFKLYKKEKKSYPKHAFRMNFTSNHDENTWHGTEMERLGDGFEAFAVLSYLLPGMPLIYNGQEAASNKRLLFFEKDLIDWKSHPIRNIYQRLNELKKKNSSLWNGEKGGDLIELTNNNSKSVISFLRKNNDDVIIAIINLTDKTQKVSVDIPKEFSKLKNVFENNKINLPSNNSFQLNPWEYVVYSTE